MPTTQQISEALDSVMDPELGRGLVKLGLIRGIEVDDRDVHVDLQLTSPSCPFADQIVADIKHTISSLDDIGEVEVELVWPNC
jgi:ATP-binding protein involved in chromosome partitioning